MTPPERGPHWTRLGELRAEVDVTRKRVADLELAERRASRAADAARAPLLSYLDGLEGAEPDAAEVGRLSAPIAAASAMLTMRPATRGRWRLRGDRL